MAGPGGSETTPNEAQSAAWNGAESAHYIDEADRYDRQLAPFTDALVERARIGPRDAVLDIGCGTGTTTLAAAGRARRVLGVDISEPLLDVGARRARSAAIDNAEFVVADAQTHPFDPDFDAAISQFGLMFFDDPVAAFTNIGRALTPGGRIVFLCWQGLEANEWLMALGQALEPKVDLPPLGGLEAGPGMFALMDPDETATLLERAGFTDVDVEAVTPTIVLGGGGTLDESIDFLLGTGIARGLLGRVEADERPDVIDALREVLASHHRAGVGVELGAAGWVVSARV